MFEISFVNLKYKSTFKNLFLQLIFDAFGKHTCLCVSVIVRNVGRDDEQQNWNEDGNCSISDIAATDQSEI